MDIQNVRDVWRYCPRCGAGPNNSDGESFECGSCQYSHYFSPFGAVGAIICDAANRILFIVRAKDPGAGKLGLPGGFIDAGETAEESLIREVKEEVGLDVVRFQYLASFPNTYTFRGITSPVTDLFYTCRVESLEDIQPQDGEVDGWKFLLMDEITPEMLAFNTHWQALEALRSH